MGMVNVFGQNQKNDVMKDTWGHMYPEPKSKHTGVLIVALCEYGDQTIITTEFPTLLTSSPMRYALEQSIFELYNFEIGVYRVECTLWFYKDVADAYLGTGIGKIIKSKATRIKIY